MTFTKHMDMKTEVETREREILTSSIKIIDITILQK
jgi:hypothetical protein